MFDRSDQIDEIMLLILGMYLIIQSVLAQKMCAKRIHLVKPMQFVAIV
jgi:hypothetical protein